MMEIIRRSDAELISGIRTRINDLRSKAAAIRLDEGLHRSSTLDDYYEGGADALKALADELEVPVIYKAGNDG